MTCFLIFFSKPPQLLLIRRTVNWFNACNRFRGSGFRVNEVGRVTVPAVMNENTRDMPYKTALGSGFISEWDFDGM